MTHAMMHNYFDIRDFHEIYKQILGIKEIQWLNYKEIIPKMKNFLESEYRNYQESYIEVSKWNESENLFKARYKECFKEKNKTEYDIDQSWPLSFGQYILLRNIHEKENELLQFLVYLDKSMQNLFIDNCTVDNNYKEKITFPDNYEKYVEEMFFTKGNRWIKKCEIIFNELKEIKFDYYVFNPIIKNELSGNNLDMYSDQLLIVKGKHFIVYTINSDNYYRIDFDVPKNIEHVYSSETEESYISAIKVFRIDDRIKIYIPKTNQRNIVLDSIY